MDGPAIGASTEAQIAFPQAFGNDKPMLFVSVRNSKCDGSQFAATITMLSEQGATVFVERIDAQEAWQSAAVELVWLAFDHDDDVVSSDLLLMAGEAMMSIAPEATAVTNVSIALGDSADAFVVNKPVILMSLQQKHATAPYFFATMTNFNGNTSFGNTPYFFALADAALRGV